MDSIEATLIEKLKYFTTSVACLYENTLNEYIRIIDNNIQQPGTTFSTILNILGIGEYSLDVFEGGATASSAVSLKIFITLLNKYSCFTIRKDIIKLLGLLYFFKKEPETVRRILVESAYRIFTSFECQFVEAVVVEEEQIIWERALTKLAEDAVGRIIDFLKKNPDRVFNVDSVISGVILGESYTVYTILNKNMKEWNTAKLFSDIGLIQGNQYYCKKSAPNATQLYGYRISLEIDDLDQYQIENKPQQRSEYEYVLQTTDIDINDMVTFLVDAINLKEHSNEKTEERIENVVVQTSEEVKDDIKKLEERFAEKLHDVQKIMNDNIIEFQVYLNLLVEKIDQKETKTNDRLERIEQQSVQTTNSLARIEKESSRKLDIIQGQNISLFNRFTMFSDLTVGQFEQINQQNEDRNRQFGEMFALFKTVVDRQYEES